jgi:PIN domain nuclease of toxin-antitoxin system
VSSYILDASALLAYINDEPGGKLVEHVLEDATISAINLTEVCSKLIRAGMDPDETRELLFQCCPNVEAVDRDQAETAGMIHAATARFNVSYADSCCMALGASRGTTVLTGDRKWLGLELGFDVDIRLIREGDSK